MDIANLVRSFIFLVAGSFMIFFPRKVYKFQAFFLDKLRIKYKLKIEDEKYYLRWGTVFIIISIILFLYSIS